MMRISNVNMYSPSFGQVRRSAAERAIKEINRDISKLQMISDLIDSQENNKQYDVIAAPNDSFHKYEVVRGEDEAGEGIMCNDIYDACFMASEWAEETPQKIVVKQPVFDMLAAEVLAKCKD